MREIKFRAWDGKRMAITDSNDNYWFRPNLDTTRYKNQCLNISSVLSDKKLKVMQYTGLIDKNGVEIYEGEIMEWHDSCVPKGEDTTKRSVVSWNPRRLMFEGWHSGVSVGNIYQNPELIK